MYRYLIIFGLSATLWAQTKPTTPGSSNSTPTKQANQTVQNSSQLTKVEQLELENISLKGTLLQQQQQQLQQQYNQIMNDVNTAHPGYHLVGMQLMAMPKIEPKDKVKK